MVEALPTALMKPLRRHGKPWLMVDVINHFGVDSLVARIAGCIQGSTDTTFYILAVYFGSVGVKKTRYAVPFALMADVVARLRVSPWLISSLDRIKRCWILSFRHFALSLSVLLNRKWQN